MASDWYLRVGEKVYGPADLATLSEWQREGRVIATNEIRRGDSGEWQLAGAIEELFPPSPKAATDTPVRRRSWREIVSDTFSIYRRAFWQLCFAALLTAVPSFFLQELVPFALPKLDGSMPQFPKLSPAAVGLLLLLIFLWPISTAAMQLAADHTAHRERRSLRDLLRNSFALWPRMLLLGLLVYGSYFFWLAIPFTAMISLATGAPSVMSLLLVLAIGTFTVYMNARLFINFLFWEQAGALSGLGGLEALRESKHLARSRGDAPPRDRPLYRGAIVASVWLLLVIACSIAVQVPFALVRFAGVTNPEEALAIAQRISAQPQNDALTLTANIVAALLHVLLRPLLAVAFLVLYYDARADSQRT